MEDLVSLLRPALERAGAAQVASWLSPRALVACVLGDTRFAAAALETLRQPESPAAQQVIAAFPEVAALAHPAPNQVEHDPSESGRPLLDHIASRLLGKKLLGLETADLFAFQREPGLSEPAFAALSTITRRVLDAGLGPALRAAVLHLDIAKTASQPLRAQWQAQGIALEVHNEAAAAIVRRANRTWELSAPLARLAIAWVEAHGLAGQHVRGEGPVLMFAPLVGALRDLAPSLGRVLGVEPHRAVALALDGLHVLNACDTAAVREGLLDDALLGKLARVRDQLVIVAAQASFTEPAEALAALAPPPTRPALVDRLRSLRAGRQAGGEPVAAIEAAVAHLDDFALDTLARALATCQLWYCEAATSPLSPVAQLALLAVAVGAAHTHDVDTQRPWHAQLRPLVARLVGDAPAVRYRIRLVEAALARHSIHDLLAGRADLAPVGAITTRLASTTVPDAVVIDVADSDESAALLTLLGIYEQRSQAQFHHMLKALCDLYGLRKDDFDRVANEASYLATMNSARSDKQRMLDYVTAGRIVEVGPGGGVVLDLLEQRFADAEIIGVDLSREVIAALESRAKAGKHRWRVVLGAAEQLPELAHDVDTVIFCSILHEVFSYATPPFSMAAVERVLRAAYASLRPGGRIVIRDGIRPPDATRRITFVAPDARSTFDLYVAQFEGRRMEYKDLAENRVELSAADAMEFLYTYTWGPASFPYEVRELYGIMTYNAYVHSLLQWCEGARVVEVPLTQRSYLQPGYRDGLAGKIELTDERDLPVDLPDSNALIVIEKPT
ncbi:MAG: methyltransferase domain-containing protein [Deltaproteobacteria bacterium]|nr:methyltransferase domain-containing protein [Deltaproteobacteria bacterium]